MGEEPDLPLTVARDSGVDLRQQLAAELRRAVLRRAGASIAGVAVDHGGLVVEALPAAAALLHVTPSHQYPLGAFLPVERRIAVLDCAATTGALAVEDDYDGEFRFRVGTLSSSATGTCPRPRSTGGWTPWLRC